MARIAGVSTWPAVAAINAPSDAIVGRVIELARDLRGAGVDASLVELLDAVRALEHVDIGDRLGVRTALRSTLVKRPEDRDVFELLFERHLPLSPATADRPAPAIGGGSADGVSTAASAAGAAGGPPAALLRAITEGDDEALLLLAIGAVDAYGGMEGMVGGERYFLYRIMRALDLSNVLVAIMRQLRAEGVDGLELTMRRDQARQRLEQYRRLLAAEIRRRLPADDRRPGTGLVAPRRIEDLDVLGATTTELRQLRAAVRPLARKLASRLGQQRRRHRRGRLDVRRTLRRSLDAGGTPLDPAFRQRRTSKPRLVVLCDLSGSVAEFAHFTLALLQALRNELTDLRTFAFVDGVAEVTAVMQRAEVALDPRLLVTLPGVVARDGHSDYDGALAAFVERHADALGPGTTLLVAGDGRTNYRPSGAARLGEIKRRCRRVYWFNPEPADVWDEGDSALADYRPWCDGVFEVRSLAQLADAVAAII